MCGFRNKQYVPFFSPRFSELSLDAGRQNLFNCPFFFSLFFFQNKLFNINTDYPIAHFKESNSNFQNFGDLIFFRIYGQSPRSPQHGFFSLSSVFFQRTL